MWNASNPLGLEGVVVGFRVKVFEMDVTLRYAFDLRSTAHP